MEWMIVAGGICGALGGFGALLVAFTVVWQARAGQTHPRWFPRARLLRPRRKAIRLPA